MGEVKIKSIEYAGKADVYNMEVDDTHDFVVNGGFVVHNCYDALKYVCMENPLNPPRMAVWTPPQEDPLNMWN